MSSFNPAKISTWRIGFSKWQVKKGKESEKIMKEHVGYCDPDERVIWINECCYNKPDLFIETLIHEIYHAIDSIIAIENHDTLRMMLNKCDQIAEHEDMMVELRSQQFLKLMSDNNANMKYILAHIEKN